jgi:hypothetical protein
MIFGAIVLRRLMPKVARSWAIFGGATLSGAVAWPRARYQTHLPFIVT